MICALYIVLALAIAFGGSCVFSFVNVLVWRIPRKLDWVQGRSFCPSCHHELGTADLVPVLSWLFLRGRCRYCGAKIGAHDTVWELVGAAAALLCWAVWGLGLSGLLAFALMALLAAIAGIDHATRIIPNGLVVAVAVVGVASLMAGLFPAAGAALPAPLDLSAALGTTSGTSSLGLPLAAFPTTGIPWWSRLVGALVASVPLFVLALLTGGFGGGDVKLFAALGLCLGWKLTLVALFASVLGGGVYGIALLATRRAGRKDAFAFGPFICAGAAIAATVGEPLLRGYLSLFGLA